MSAPVYDYLKNLSEQNPYPFHMPGHKRQIPFDINPFSMDITEIIGADNLHKPDGIIKDALKLLSELVGSDESFYLVNGSTCGLMSAVMSICREKDKIVVARNCHRSVYNGLLLSGAMPVYLSPDLLPNGLQGGISLEQIKLAVNQHPDIKAVILTSPTYEGFCSDIKSIATYLHSLNKILIVDEAHGAHFGYCDFFPKSAIKLGADIVIQSWHKTLPVLTQCSVAHIKSNLVDIERFKTYLSMLQTTSPSYLFMATLDKCREMLAKNSKNLFEEYTEKLKFLRNSLSDLSKIQLLGSEVVGHYSITDIDLSKLIFVINSDIAPNMLENMLIKDYNLQIEASGLNHLILMTSIMDTTEGYEQLNTALHKIEENISYKASPVYKINRQKISVPSITPKEAFELKSTVKPFTECCGELAADFITPYPPGIPILSVGEKITGQHIEIIRENLASGINVLGVNNNNINVLC